MTRTVIQCWKRGLSLLPAVLLLVLVMILWSAKIKHDWPILIANAISATDDVDQPLASKDLGAMKEATWYVHRDGYISLTLSG